VLELLSSRTREVGHVYDNPLLAREPKRRTNKWRALYTVNYQPGDAVTKLDPLHCHAQIVPQGGDMGAQNAEEMEGRTGIKPA